MPTYQYRCKSCGHELEARQSFSDDALTDCPACQAATLTKVFSSIGISFKGDGFYKNDHGANAKSRSSNGSESSNGSDSSSSSPPSDKTDSSSSSPPSSGEKSTASSSSSASATSSND